MPGKRSYTAQQKAEALELYRTDGPTAVEHDLGIPKGTATRWAQAAGVTTVSTENTRVRVEAARVKWEERRVALAHESGSVADLALSVARQNLAAGKARDAQSAATTYAILVDKAQLLTGAATSRTETITGGIDAAVVELERELALSGPA